MNRLPSFLKLSPDHIVIDPPLDLDAEERALAELVYDAADDAKKSVVSARKSQTKKPPRCTVSPEVVQ